jgi:beta-glucosidase
MNMLRYGALSFLALSLINAASASSDPVEKKVDDLLAQMTLDEKVGQMTQVDLSAIRDKSDVQKYFLGSMLSGGGSDPSDITAKGWAKAYDELQSYALQTRLKIPMIYGIDAVHGHNNVDGAVIFPHHIALGATHNAQLVERAERVTALEVAGTGMNWVFDPCIAVARDIRWGRTYESFGESPELAALMGVASVRGLQGRKLKQLADNASVVACVKHYLGDGGTTGGTDQGNTVCDEETLRKIHLPGYIATLKAGAQTVMASYSSWNGKKMHGNKYLITGVLKEELKFDGFVVSDWAAIDQLGPNFKQDIEESINAGLDMVMIPSGPGRPNNYVEFIKDLKELVAENRVPQSRIDDATRRILRVKIRSGLFEHPLSIPALTAQVGSPEHRAIARDCVRQSLVLLKNDRKTLPLSKAIKNLVVTGPGANDLGMQCGGWTIDWQGKLGKVTSGGTTIYEAIRKALPATATVTLSNNGDAKGANAVIVVIGEKPYAEGRGDRKDLNLSDSDIALVKQAKESGAPVITLLLSGRPMILESALSASDAFIAAWLPGTEGQGVADVLFGDVKPTGTLPQTWPASMDQIPIHKGDANAKAALFPYGFGLKY